MRAMTSSSAYPAQSLDEAVPVDCTELHMLQTMILGKLARDLIRDVEVPPIVYVHS
jgi:hypothetical protein